MKFEDYVQMIAADITDRRINELEDCIKDLVYQFATVSKGKLHSDGSSALADAFAVLGWTDPCDSPAHLMCDVPGCGAAITNGWREWWVTSDKRYRQTCRKHYRERPEP